MIGTISQSSSRVSVDTPQDEWKVASTTMAAARQYVAAAEVMHQQGLAAPPASGWRATYGIPADFFAWLRLREAREQLQYTLVRERFVLIPLGNDGQMLPENFEFNEYLLQVCCDGVKEASTSSGATGSR